MKTLSISHKLLMSLVVCALGAATLPALSCDHEGMVSAMNENIVAPAALAEQRACTSSRDCMPSTEHCLNGKCELRSMQCHASFDCTFPELCEQGVCKLP